MRKRAAFTLVEMLVSMALILFVMVILSQAFTTGLQVFRQLKALGDMEQRLRAAAQTLRRDLSAYHFENYRKLSDTSFWTDGPPQQGFFRIWQGAPSTSEGVDLTDGNPSSRATNHYLHFTSKLAGQNQGDFATSALPPQLTSQALVTGGADSRYQQAGQFRGRWYEVVYFMQPTGQSTGTGGAQLYTLFRRQFGILDVAGVVPSVASQLNSLPTPIRTTDGLDWWSFSEISCKKSTLNLELRALNSTTLDPTIYSDDVHFNSPADLTMPAKRFGMLPAQIGSVEMVGLPADPFLPTALGGQISGRNYPYLGDVPRTSPWNQPAAKGKPWFTYPPTWQGNGALQGADLLLTDVISFEVKVLASGGSDFSDLPTGNNSVLSAAGIGVFDTWSSQNDGTYDYSGWNNPGTATSAPLPQITIAALRITIRLWDAKTQQVRQVSIIQDM